MKLNYQFAVTILKKPEPCAVEHLDLSNNNLTLEQIIYLFGLLEQHKEIISLDLSKNQIGNIGIATLVAVMTNNATIAQLNLSDNQISDNEGIAALLQIVTNNKTITHLNLSKNIFNDQVIDLIQALSISKVSHLSLSGCNIGNESVIELAKNNRTITYLDLSDNHIEDESIIDLVKNNRIITHLNLSQNHSISLSNIATLIDNKTIIYLNLPKLQYLPITAPRFSVNIKPVRDKRYVVPVQVLINKLAINSTITYLNLSSYGIIDEEATILANHNKRISHLNLSHNFISDNGAVALSRNKFFVYLNLSFNQVSTLGAQYIVSVNSNNIIAYLDLSYNKINLSEIIPLLADNNSITNLNLSHNIMAFITELDLLDHQRIKGQILVIQRALINNRTIVDLNLSTIGIHHPIVGARAVEARREKGRRTLVSLHVLKYLIMDSIISSLINNKIIRKLNFSGNRINDYYIKELMRSNTIKDLIIFPERTTFVPLLGSKIMILRDKRYFYFDLNLTYSEVQWIKQVFLNPTNETLENLLDMVSPGLIVGLNKFGQPITIGGHQKMRSLIMQYQHSLPYFIQALQSCCTFFLCYGRKGCSFMSNDKKLPRDLSNLILSFLGGRDQSLPPYDVYLGFLQTKYNKPSSYEDLGMLPPQQASSLTSSTEDPVDSTYFSYPRARF